MRADTIVQSARECATSFTPLRHPEGTLLRTLARIQRRLLIALVRVAPRAVTTTWEIEFPVEAADITDGIALPGPAARIHQPMDLWLTGDTKPRPMSPIDWADRHRATGRAVWFNDNRLFLSGVVADWSDVSSLVVTYTPLPKTVAITDDIVLPESAEDLLVKQLASFMAGRTDASELGRPRSEYAKEAEVAEEQWLRDAEFRLGPTVSVTPEGW